MSAELLDLAETVIATPLSKLGADRPLAAVLLLRQALEEVLDDWWTATLPAMVATTRRDQLVTLPFYLDDPALTGEVTWAWNRLSATCHHHAYGVPPLDAELHRLLATIRGLSAHVLRDHGTTRG